MKRKTILFKYWDALSVAVEQNDIDLINILHEKIFQLLPFLNEREKNSWIETSSNFKGWGEFETLTYNIIYHYDLKIISIESLDNFKMFDRFDKKILSKSDFKKLYNKAKKLYFEVTNRNDFKKQVCFISSSDLHGFYFPNVEKITCISFIDGRACAIV